MLAHQVWLSSAARCGRMSDGRPYLSGTDHSAPAPCEAIIQDHADGPQGERFAGTRAAPGPPNRKTETSGFGLLTPVFPRITAMKTEDVMYCFSRNWRTGRSALNNNCARTEVLRCPPNDG